LIDIILFKKFLAHD